MKSIFIILLLIPILGSAQLSSDENLKIDSIKNVIHSANHDSIIIQALIDWDNMIYFNNPELDLRLNKKIDSLSQKNLSKKIPKKVQKFFLLSKAMASNNLGIIYKKKGDFNQAIKYFNKGLILYEKLNHQKGIVNIYNNIGNVYSEVNEYKKAIEYYEKCLVINKKLNKKNENISTLTNIGLIYEEQGIEYIKKGNRLVSDNKFDSAIIYFSESLALSEEYDDQYGIGINLNSLGIAYQERGIYDIALDYHLKSLKIKTEINDQYGMAASYVNIGAIYKDLGDFKNAIHYSEIALELGQKINDIHVIKDVSKNLSAIHQSQGKYKESLEMMLIHLAAKDTLLSEENERAIFKQEYKYTYEKQAATDSVKTAEEKKVKDAEIARQDAEIKVKNNQQLMLYGGLALVLVFAGFIFNRFRITNKQKKIIEQQKHEVEEKNKEITDSITYAKRIQSAILPPHKIVKEYLPHSFILYKPKDIVAGDFYWLEHTNNKILIAACDCTGHGVPGAMVSVVCNNGLNRSVREYGLTEPGKILDKTREIVIQEFEKSEEEVKDGMDVSLCSLDLDNLKLTWAGANNPLWIIRNSELIEYKPNKQPIGKYSEPKPFTTLDIDLQKGDSIYIFTDGFSDQFGGEKGKKFKSAKFKELLLSIQDNSMEEQKGIIDETFENWTGNLEQNDDVCVIGIRI